MNPFLRTIKYVVAGAAFGSQFACSNIEHITVTQFSDRIYALGESPWWDASKNELVTIDIEGEALVVLSADGKQVKHYPLTGKPGTVIPTDKGNYLIAMGNAVVVFSEKQGIINTVSQQDFSIDTLRFNDGKVSPDGYLWVGTVDCKTYSQPTASLYRTKGGEMIPQLTGITVSNGISWSPDGSIMYYIDSPTRTVKAYDYDTQTGSIFNERIVIKTPEDWGTPDGCSIDAQGNLWVAQWGGACVALWDTKSGSMIHKIDVPAKNVTAVALGGKDMNELFITTASIAMDAEDVPKYPLAGAVFTCKVQVPGILRSRWKE